MSARERAAVDVVNGWIGGWTARDPMQVAHYMADDVYWSGGYPGNPLNGIWRGRDRFVQHDGGATLSGVDFKMAEVLALGGSTGTAVLYRRIDTFGGPGSSFGGGGGGTGRRVWFTNAVFNWVQDGKIQIWFDAPILFPPVPQEQAPPLSSFAQLEQAGLEVVKNWVAAWNGKDPDKVASYMADGVEYSSDYPQHITELGRAHFLAGHRGNIAQGVSMRIDKSLALGGNKGTAVMLRRVDSFSVNGRRYEVPNASFFWVEGGKITKWVDVPLETPPDSSPGVPAVR
jgi:limonene-1,2-epoxide hydrolase